VNRRLRHLRISSKGSSSAPLPLKQVALDPGLETLTVMIPQFLITYRNLPPASGNQYTRKRVALPTSKVVAVVIEKDLSMNAWNMVKAIALATADGEKEQKQQPAPKVYVVTGTLLDASTHDAGKIMLYMEMMDAAQYATDHSGQVVTFCVESAARCTVIDRYVGWRTTTDGDCTHHQSLGIKKDLAHL
jgi:hypothetical protein